MNKQEYKNLNWNFITLVICFTILLIYFIYILNENGSEWISFWGGILGSIIGIGGIYLHFKKQKEHEKEVILSAGKNFFLYELNKLEKYNKKYIYECLRYSEINIIRTSKNNNYINFIFDGFSKNLIERNLEKLTLEPGIYKNVLSIMNFHLNLEKHLNEMFYSQNDLRELIKKVITDLESETIKSNPNYNEDIFNKLIEDYYNIKSKRVTNKEELKSLLDFIKNLHDSIDFVLKEDFFDLGPYVSRLEWNLNYFLGKEGLDFQYKLIKNTIHTLKKHNKIK